MKNKLKEIDIASIAEKVREKLPDGTSVYYGSNNNNWKFYCSFSGYSKDKYFDLYFRESVNGTKSIEIARPTENPMEYVKVIKEIEPDANIKYYEVITRYTEKNI